MPNKFIKNCVGKNLNYIQIEEKSCYSIEVQACFDGGNDQFA